MNYPVEICHECGAKYGQRNALHDHTCWNGTCEICGETGTVTSPRDFGHLKPGWEKETKNELPPAKAGGLNLGMENEQ